MPEETSTRIIAACSQCGALSLVPDWWVNPWPGAYVRACSIVYPPGACPGNVQVIGRMTVVPPNG